MPSIIWTESAKSNLNSGLSVIELSVSARDVEACPEILGWLNPKYRISGASSVVNLKLLPESPAYEFPVASSKAVLSTVTKYSVEVSKFVDGSIIIWSIIWEFEL